MQRCYGTESDGKLSLDITKCPTVIFCIMLAQAGFGITYVHDCPKQPFIPIYLIVMGCGSLVFCCGCEKISWISLFFFIWLIVGSVFIKKIYKPQFSQDAGEEYCNPTLYWFAFGSNICTYFLIIALSCRCVLKRHEGDKVFSVEV